MQQHLSLQTSAIVKLIDILGHTISTFLDYTTHGAYSTIPAIRFELSLHRIPSIERRKWSTILFRKDGSLGNANLSNIPHDRQLPCNASHRIDAE